MIIKRSKSLKHSFPAGNDASSYPYAQSAEVFNQAELELYSEIVGPGRSANAAHYHEKIDEIIFVLAGSLEVSEANETQVLSVGDSVLFQAGTKLKHCARNPSDQIDCTFLLIRKTTSLGDVCF